MWENTSLITSTRKENADPVPADESQADTDMPASDEKVNFKELRPAIWKQRRKINKLKASLHEVEQNAAMGKTKQEKQKEETEKQALVDCIIAEEKELKKISEPLHRVSVVRAFFIRWCIDSICMLHC